VPDYPDLAETVIFMSGRSSFILQQGVREGTREEVYVQYFSYLLLNLETINKSYEPFHLPQKLKFDF
jgi:hypothetical protein